jgi:hypothetical protein
MRFFIEGKMMSNDGLGNFEKPFLFRHHLIFSIVAYTLLCCACSFVSPREQITGTVTVPTQITKVDGSREPTIFSQSQKTVEPAVTSQIIQTIATPPNRPNSGLSHTPIPKTNTAVVPTLTSTFPITSFSTFCPKIQASSPVQSAIHGSVIWMDWNGRNVNTFGKFTTLKDGQL